MTDVQSEAAEPDPMRFLTYRGRIGRGLYFLGLLFEFFLMFMALAFLAQAMNSTGSGGGPALIYVVTPLIFWIHSLITTKRLRDAGKPFGTQMFYAFAPYSWVVLAVPFLWINSEMLERILADTWPILTMITVALLLLPGIMPRKPDIGDAPAQPA